MGHIVAIGGGEIGRPGYPIETESIDKEIIKATNKKHPRLLFLPTASFDSDSYIEVVKGYYGQRLGCDVDHLKLTVEKDMDVIKRKVEEADIVYVGGGDSRAMIRSWKGIGFDDILKRAYLNGKVLAGVSAGAVCWFERCLSDYRSFIDPKDRSYNPLKCLGIVKGNITIAPHLIRESGRLYALMRYIDKKGGIGLGIDDKCALEIRGDKFRVLVSDRDSGLYKVYKKKGNVCCARYGSSEQYMPFDMLLKKD